MMEISAPAAVTLLSAVRCTPAGAAESHARPI
jgi:hypothetical protein